MTDDIMLVNTGDVDLLVGLNASLSLPTGDGPLLMLATSMVFACFGVSASSAVGESTRVTSRVAAGSTDSAAIKGEERVR